MVRELEAQKSFLKCSLEIHHIDLVPQAYIYSQLCPLNSAKDLDGNAKHKASPKSLHSKVHWPLSFSYLRVKNRTKQSKQRKKNCWIRKSPTKLSGNFKIFPLFLSYKTRSWGHLFIKSYHPINIKYPQQLSNLFSYSETFMFISTTEIRTLTTSLKSPEIANKSSSPNCNKCNRGSILWGGKKYRMLQMQVFC